MRVDRPYEDHRHLIAAMDMTKRQRDADSERPNVFRLGFSGFTILTDFVADFLALSE